MVKTYKIYITLLCLYILGYSNVSAQNYIQLLTDEGSDLPLIIISTNEEIVDEPKISGHMGIINNGTGSRNYLSQSFEEYDGFIGIELRGQSSLRKWDKTSFAIETRDSAGNNNNVSIFGMPSENDWVLNAAYYDKTLVRMPVIYELSRKMGNWASNTQFCEVIVNSEYMGIYIFMEKIKIDKNRVDIKKLNEEDIVLPNLSGGYIYEFTSARWGEPDHYEIKSPNSNNILPQQAEYISDFYVGFDELMVSDQFNDPDKGYLSIIDMNSFIDEIIIWEMTKSVDAYRYSSYFYKEREGNLYAGPIWDFDQSFGNSVNNGGVEISEWVYTNATNTFWPKLIKEVLIQQNLRTRWNELRNRFFNTDTILSRVDFYVAQVEEAQQRNFERWPILGEKTWREPDNLVGNITYSYEVDYMKQWISDRLEWLDGYFEIPKNIVDITQFHKLEGTIIGSSGSFSNQGNTIENVFDGNLNTYFDSPIETKDDAWVGYDLGYNNKYVIRAVGYSPRVNWAERMVGGFIEGANNPLFLGPEKILDIFVVPLEGIMTYKEVKSDNTFRYLRYRSPINGYGNISELEFYTDPITAVFDESLFNIPKDFKVSNNYPNPFNPTTKINYGIPENGTVKIQIYNVIGEVLELLENDYKNAGYYSIEFNAEKYNSGVYFYKIEYIANGRLNNDVKKMLLIK